MDPPTFSTISHSPEIFPELVMFPAPPVIITPAKVKGNVAGRPERLPLIEPEFVTVPPLGEKTAVPTELLSVPFASTVRVRATSRLTFEPIVTAPRRPASDPIVRSPACAVADPEIVAICAVPPFATTAAKLKSGVLMVQLSGLNQSPVMSKRKLVQ